MIKCLGVKGFLRKLEERKSELTDKHLMIIEEYNNNKAVESAVARQKEDNFQRKYNPNYEQWKDYRDVQQQYSPQT
jgi:molybdenum-dependent DNA-binding transcriptional regulator ModE